LTAVYSRASGDYVRAQNPDGTFQPESYVFKEGGNFGGPRVDPTMDTLSFEDVSPVIARSLAARNYQESVDPATTKLLIVVYWGTTIGPEDNSPQSSRESSQLTEWADAHWDTDPGHAAALRAEAGGLRPMEAGIDGKIDARSANILGYTDEIFRTSPHDPWMNTLRDEIEEDRYYVVLLAYDYQAARNQNERRLLWETRFSVPERGNDFEKAFPMMASIASKYFGQDSHGLVHHNLADGHVEVGEPRSLGTLPGK
ncbi:MAG TPA: hypothetical protein VII09_01540, partial [Opitutaceae bacterium]